MRPSLVHRIDVSVERLRRLSTIIIPFYPYRIRLKLSEVPPLPPGNNGRIRQCPSSRCFGNILAREAVSCVSSETLSQPSGEKDLAIGEAARDFVVLSTTIEFSASDSGSSKA